MVLAGYDTSNLVALYNGGVQCETCCTPEGGFAGTDCGCFIEGDGSPPACSSNPDFDVFPPFGGPGKTPGVYTITIEGYQLCPFPLNSPAPDINGTWHLPYVSHPDNCAWFLSTTIGGIIVRFSLVLCESGTFQFDVQMPGETPFLHILYLNVCAIVIVNAPNFRAGCGNPGEHSGFGGIVSWRPSQIAAWDSVTLYVIGDIVAHEGVFYECTANNTNKEPPDIAFWVVI